MLRRRTALWRQSTCVPAALPPRPQIGQGLQQLTFNNKILDLQLEQLSKGLVRLRTIAADQRKEILLQEVVVDQMGDRVRTATDHVGAINSRLERVRLA
jgi:hypothetical protein